MRREGEKREAEGKRDWENGVVKSWVVSSSQRREPVPDESKNRCSALGVHLT